MFERPAAADILPQLDFPAGFSWGVSTAAYQIEGAAKVDGRGPSIWDTFSHTPGAVLNGDTGDIACDHYNRLDEDLDLLRDLGVDVYRFSIAWSRIQPAGRGAPNQAGIDFYSRMVDGLLARGIKPVPTLYHWDLPQGLFDAGEDWQSRAVVERFADYAEIVFGTLGDRVELWTTINEPWVIAHIGYGLGVHAPGITDVEKAARAHHHLLLSHGAAVERLRAMAPAAKVGIALNLMHIYPASDHADDVAAAALADAQLNGSFLDPIFTGRYPENLGAVSAVWARGADVVRDGDMEWIAQPVDFLSINTYHPRWVCTPDRLTAARTNGFDGGHNSPLAFDLPILDVLPIGLTRTAMGWPIHPDGLLELLKRLGQRYPDMPLYISENGFAGTDYRDHSGAAKDGDRVAYLDGHLRAARAAIDAGVDLRGYWQWSFMDNFEWSFGYSARFGLIHIDYPTRTRTPKSSYHWYRDVVANNRLPEGGRPPSSI